MRLAQNKKKVKKLNIFMVYADARACRISSTKVSMTKRILGLGQRNKGKKRKIEKSNPDESNTTEADRILVEMDEHANLDDELTQLKGLWDNFFDGNRENEYVLNGIIHECDRLLRQSKNDEKSSKLLNDEFYAIYALALAELAIFKTEEENEDISQYFDQALERVELAIEEDSFKDSNLLKLTISKIIFQRIPLQFISKLKLDSKSTDVTLDLFEQVEKAKRSFNVEVKELSLAYEVLQMFDDILDMLENFGRNNNIEEGLDSDEEDEGEPVCLDKGHPLYRLHNTIPENYCWLRETMIKLSGKAKESELCHNINQSLGRLFLKAAEEPTGIFLQQYQEKEKQVQVPNEIKRAQKHALFYTRKALDYLENAQKEDEPETWVQVAEAYIDVGNLEDYQSSEQEKAYVLAEDILKRANRASHGKYQNILDNLVNKDQD